MGQRFHRIAGLHRNDSDPQRACGLNLFQRQAAERAHGLPRIALTLCRLLLGRKNEAIDVAAEAQGIDPELPLIAAGRDGGRRKAVDRELFRAGLVDVFHPARIEIIAERLVGRHADDIEAHRLLAAFAHADDRLRGVVERKAIRRLEGEAELGMQETASAHEAFARILAIDDVVDRGEIGFVIALATFG